MPQFQKSKDISFFWRKVLQTKATYEKKNTIPPIIGDSDMKKRAIRYNVLAIAEAANPEWTSVPLLGWSLASALGERANIHLVTQIRNRSAILRQGYIEGKDFTVIDSEMVMKPLWKLTNILRGGKGKGWTTSMAISSIGYYYFEYLLWEKFKSYLLNGKFDIVHRITPLSPTVPSLLAKKCDENDIPFIMGPINGGVPWPKEFDKARRQEREWLSYVRGAYKLLPGYKSTLESAKGIIVGSRDTEVQIPKKYHEKCIYLPENAVDPKKFPFRATSRFHSTLRACFVGRLVPYKGPDMVLEAAIPLLKERKLKIDIIGDGPLLPQIKRIAAEHEIEDQLTLHGWVDHAAIHEIMCRSQILAFPSIREFGGGVVLEAMALGLVPIVIDYGGPGELVDSSVGIKIPLSSRENIISELQNAFFNITEGNINIKGLSICAAERVKKNFTWAVKANQINLIYKWIIDNESTKPTLF